MGLGKTSGGNPLGFSCSGWQAWHLTCLLLDRCPLQTRFDVLLCDFISVHWHSLIHPSIHLFVHSVVKNPDVLPGCLVFAVFEVERAVRAERTEQRAKKKRFGFGPEVSYKLSAFCLCRTSTSSGMTLSISWWVLQLLELPLS